MYPSPRQAICLYLATSLLILCQAFVGPSVSRRKGLAVLVVPHATVNGDERQTTLSSDIAARTRKDFPILNDRKLGDKLVPLVYLDSAATSQKPQQVLDKLNYYYRNINANVHRGAHTLSREATAAYEDAREKVSHFINANSREEVVFTSGATEAINLVVQSYGRENLGKGDEVVLTAVEHHANLVPWQMLAKEKGLTLKFVKIDPATGTLDLKHFESLLTPNTKMVGFQHVSNVLASINPVDQIVEMIRSRCPDAKILLDACQSVPHMPTNVQELGVDFLVASGHKMCAPTGIGFLWGRLDLLNSMPPYQGGGEMIDEVTLEGSTFQPSPARFEAGTPAIAQAVGLGAAIDYLTEIGMDKIEAYEMEMGNYLYERLSEVPGITIFGPKENRVALAAFCHESVHPSDIATFLDMDGVAVRAGHHCCQPLHKELGYSHSARASLAFYNTKE
jgi:cysteine desulfurase/selenocysteine lyase